MAKFLVDPELAGFYLVFLIVICSGRETLAWAMGINGVEDLAAVPN